MSEEAMVQAIENALVLLGVQEEVEAAGEFQPRGHTGAMFAGGFIGDELGSGFGNLGDSIATVGGAIAGGRIHDATTGLPTWMMVGVTPTHVCGFGEAKRRKEAGPLVFRVPRSQLEVKVHQRVNVRILELIDSESGSRIELEGSRIPVTHTKDVIEALQQDGA
ncbi:MAG TPA: hypothetical protein PKD59_12915 [Miltoncostaeaceae bacterium]|nr:hypothetical protein [Miltoncostaeaceae bacterium]